MSHSDDTTIQQALDQVNGKAFRDALGRANGSAVQRVMKQISGPRVSTLAADVAAIASRRSGVESLLRSVGSLPGSTLAADVAAIASRRSGVESLLRSVGSLPVSTAFGGMDQALRRQLLRQELVERVATHSVENAADVLRGTAESGTLQDAVTKTVKSQWAEGIFRDIEGPQFNTLVESIRKNEDRVELSELERNFQQLGHSEELLCHAATQLELTVPFGRDPYVRAALQSVVMVVYSIVMFYVLVHIPEVAAIGAITKDPPTAPRIWRYTGAAYDRLYDRKHYHPEKGLEPPPSKGGRFKGDKGVW